MGRRLTLWLSPMMSPRSRGAPAGMLPALPNRTLRACEAAPQATPASREPAVLLSSTRAVTCSTCPKSMLPAALLHLGGGQGTSISWLTPGCAGAGLGSLAATVLTQLCASRSSMLGLDRSMSQPNLVHLAQMVAAAPLSACPSEASEHSASLASREDEDAMGAFPAAFAIIPGETSRLAAQLLTTRGPSPHVRHWGRYS